MAALVVTSLGCGDDEGASAGGAGGASSADGSGGGEPVHDYLDLPRRSGTVTVFESHVEGIRETNVVGAFLDIEEGDPGACADEAIGVCKLTFCQSGAVTLDALVDAGSLSIDFGDGRAPTVTARNAATGFYFVTLIDEDLISTGREVVIDASGSQVAPFTMALVAPPTVTVTTPLPPEGGRLPATQPLDLAWAADAEEGDVVVALRAIAANHTATLSCSFAIAAGSGRIPADAIAAVAALPATQSVTLEIETTTTAKVGSDDFQISAAIIVTALSGSLDAVRGLAGFAE